ncbi:MAG: efflux RND transporter periplasmic adaptor subunit [Proteobacteria bacterium]|uniref:efflux RND transporter periplasmic adaptor subunit n=1 Tax=Rudaea sp. TaxID=2136325 RepID=UPI0037832675|nr:efflux RND transporter periplasmic adaptor subunit [Pseudomonadota bacterium]
MFDTSTRSPLHVATATTLLLAVFALAGCGSHAAAPAPPRSAIVAHPQAADAISAEVYSGEVRARYESQLGFRVNGKIRTRKVDVGNHVEAGQVIAELDPADLQLQAGSASANLAAAKANRDLAQADYDRYHKLLDKHYVSQTQVDAQANALKAAQAQVLQAQAALAVASNQTGYTSLRADHAGVITALNAEAGQVVAAGQGVATLAWDGATEVEIAVPENRIGAYKVGAPFAIESWAEAGKQLAGHLREIGAEADRVTRTYRVRVSFDDAAAAPRLGQTARVYFADGANAGQILIPLSALHELGGKPAVWIVDAKTHQVKLAPVTVAAYREQGVTLSGGTGTQDWIVTAGVHKLHEGDTITPVDALNRPIML